jgi:Mycothiol maleylpyruvate isomerase N-terminal domain
MMQTSVLEREELRVFEELISRFDSLTEAQMNTVGVTPEWSAKDLLAHLAYWEGAAAEQVREFEARRSSPKKRTRATVERINREVVSANRATPRHLLREKLTLARSEIVAAMKRAPEELEERSPLAHIVYSQCVQHRGQSSRDSFQSSQAQLRLKTNENTRASSCKSFDSARATSLEFRHDKVVYPFDLPLGQVWIGTRNESSASPHCCAR